MTSRGAARTGARRTRPAILAALAAGAILLGGVVWQLPIVHGDPGDTTQPGVSASGLQATEVPAVPTGDGARGRPAPPGSPGQARRVRDGRTAFDDTSPGVAKLDPALRSALRRAATDAAGVVEFHVNSGWRSAAHQEQLLRAAISKYGSLKKASQWVATPQTSPHVSGDAVDIGPARAAAWLSDNGPRYGLCQIYRNEPWHYELRPQAVDHGCPSMYADPTHDPRMQ